MMRLFALACTFALAATLSVSAGQACDGGEATNYLFVYHTIGLEGSDWRSSYTNRMSSMLSSAFSYMDIEHGSENPNKDRVGVITHNNVANMVLDMNDPSVNTAKAMSNIAQVVNGGSSRADAAIDPALTLARTMLDQRLEREDDCGLYVVIFIGQMASNSEDWHGPLTEFVNSLLSAYPGLGDRIAFGTIAAAPSTHGWVNPHTNAVSSSFLSLEYPAPVAYPSDLLDQEIWGSGFTGSFCVQPEWYGCGVSDAASRATGFGSLEYLGPILAVVGLIALVVAAALFSASSKIEAPEKYPQYSMARRDFVAQSVKGGAAAPASPENLESSTPLAKSSTPMAEPGPIVSRTMTLVVAVVALAIVGGHVTLFRSFGGLWALMSLIAGLMWLISCGFAIYAFMGNNAFTNWNLVTKVVFGIDVATLLTALVILFTQAQSLVDNCVALCDQMPEDFVRNACVSACPQSVGAVILGPLITTMVILGAGGFVLSQTMKAEAGNGRVMSFGGVFPTETGFKGVAKVRPPPGGSRGSRGSDRGSRGSKRGSGRQAPDAGSRGSKRGGSNRK